MIAARNITVQFSGEVLFGEVSFLVNPKDRIGLTGKNGAGKSTLLKVMCGIHKPDEGEVVFPRNCVVGYLPQEMLINNTGTVREETAKAFEEVERLHGKVDEVSHELETRTDHDSEEYYKLIEELHHYNERLNHIGAYGIDGQIEQVLMGLGFKRKDFDRNTGEFSGGWRMRIELAKLILQQPDVLLLDEPTNHLDIDSIQWLEVFLKDYNGAVILISHDRAFLDNLTNRTIEISNKRIYDYKANYTKYVALRQERRDQLASEQKNQEKYIEQTEMLINKFRAKASKASFAQSLIKKLDKLERVELDESDNAAIHFRFPAAPASGKIVVEAKNVSKSYGEKNVFQGIDFILERGERIAFVGQNGEGKSTMSKLIAGVEGYEGELKIGHNVSIGYFAQNQSELMDENKTVLQIIDDVATGEARKKMRDLLGAFLFSGETVNKKVKVLSGGEKTRLAICRLLFQPSNLLILDEPTNHLDMRSKELLKHALKQFDGTLIVVSHDRDFLQGLSQKVYEFRDGRVIQHFGDVYDFLKSKKMDSFKELEKKQNNGISEGDDKRGSNQGKSKKNNSENGVLPDQQEVKHKNHKETSSSALLISKLEKEIARLEKEIAEKDEMLQDPLQYKELMNDKDFFNNYESLKKLLANGMEEWEKLMARAI